MDTIILEHQETVKQLSVNDPLIYLKDYLVKKAKGKKFLIPAYQRGYIWGKSRGTQKNSVEFLLESIINAYNDAENNCFNGKDLFLQGVTVCENEDTIEIIDGQQRTTILYLLLQYLGYQDSFTIDYKVRTQSGDFIKGLKGKSLGELLTICAEDQEEEFQDIYYFKKSIRIIHEKIKDLDKEALLKFLIGDEKKSGHIKFLYIVIPQERATTVFAMMNGNKAEMKAAEIIKAEMLRLVSLPNLDTTVSDNGFLSQREALRWDQNLIRSKYAREWDKWLYWWNRKDVGEFYQTSSVMGLLIETYLKTHNGKTHELNFENFRDLFLRGNDLTSNTKKAKNTFYELRHLQKKFEDIFNSYDHEEPAKRLHNKIGAIIILLNRDDRGKFINDFFGENKPIKIDEVLKYVYLGLTYYQIQIAIENKDENDSLDLHGKMEELIVELESNFLYFEHYESGCRQLLRRNIEEDTKLSRKFDFDIWKNRSLEHIYAKSKVYHDEEGVCKSGDGKVIDQAKIDSTYINRDDFNNNGSEHCIGNLVLLYKNENAKFSNSDFDQKKWYYFNLTEVAFLHSRHLIHTISMFSMKNWGVKEIQDNKLNFIKEVKEYYGI